MNPARHRHPHRIRGVAPAGGHIALTFDDGPDPRSTPAFLDLLTRHDRRATFFMVGEQALAHPGLARRVAEDGHEVAVHGWTHRCVLTVPPARLTEQLRRTRGVLEDVTGTEVTRYRPPYGMLGPQAVLAYRALSLQPVLWTAWGREWEASASPDRVVTTVLHRLRPGGTLLLHDTDLHAPHGDWRCTLEATSRLLSGVLSVTDVGPLAEHDAADVPRPLATRLP